MVVVVVGCHHLHEQLGGLLALGLICRLGNPCLGVVGYGGHRGHG
jgi:hypothetical protein